MMATLYRKRRWLNRLGYHTVGLLYGWIIREEWDDNDKTIIDISGQLTIGDCNRQVKIDLEPDANSIRKLNILIDMAVEMRDVLEKLHLDK